MVDEQQLSAHVSVGNYDRLRDPRDNVRTLDLGRPRGGAPEPPQGATWWPRSYRAATHLTTMVP